MTCCVCKNYWFVRRVQIEVPPFCPYCGVKFDGVALVSNEELRESQV
jgi:ribosomal protein L37AE/L43A